MAKVTYRIKIHFPKAVGGAKTRAELAQLDGAFWSIAMNFSEDLYREIHIKHGLAQVTDPDHVLDEIIVQGFKPRDHGAVTKLIEDSIKNHFMDNHVTVSRA